MADKSQKTGLSIVKKDGPSVKKEDKFTSAFSTLGPRVDPKRPPDSIKSNAMEFEDEFKGSYGIAQFGSDAAVIEPPYNFCQLEDLCERNNALWPCIEAMVTNIDGTGYEIVPVETSDVETDEDGNFVDPMIEKFEEFFDQPWPGMSFTTMRKELRRDMEKTGNGYLEVLRNPKGEIIFVRRVESKTVRMLELDGGFYADVEIQRGGTLLKVKTHVRRRRYLQKIGGLYVFFKEFGAERDCDKSNGKWGKEGEMLKFEQRATELIHFTVMPDIKTPYGVPRWIPQIPSILGSRRAEEINLGYFDAGGVPPALVMVQGGNLAPETRKALENFMSADPKTKNRAAVLEVLGTAGSITENAKVEVKVERFSSEQQKDSMFEQYDEKSEARIRKAFRLAPIFVGKADDYSFATAYASYTVTEAQVFKPERDEFDEKISLGLLKALGGGEYWYRSMPMTVSDASQQLAAVEKAFDAGAIDREEYVEAVNETMNLDLHASEEPTLDEQLAQQQLAQGEQALIGGEEDLKNKPKLTEQEMAAAEDERRRANEAHEREMKTPIPNPTTKKKSEDFVLALAKEVHGLVRSRDFGIAYAKAMQDVGDLSQDELQEFRSALAKISVGAELMDRKTTSEIMSDARDLLADRNRKLD